MDTTTTRNGERTRGFLVLFQHRGKRLHYPCTGYTMDGREAIDCMEQLTERGFAPLAHTEANGIAETLTLDEMREVVL